MKSKLKILVVASEVAPFAKTGGLGDVGGALPKALKDLGHDVRVITPQYRSTNERKFVLRDVIRLQNIETVLGNKVISLNVKSAFIPNTKVQVYFIDYKPFYFREGLYVDSKTGKDYTDNAQRFILFSRGVLETLKKLQWQPDVIHCNDWQSGLIPFFLKNTYSEDPFFSKISSLFTVHNFAFQGNFDASCVKYLKLNDDFNFPDSVLDFHSKCSFLKAGIVMSDMVSTVSPTYAEEVRKSPDFGFGLEDLLNKRQDVFTGILNGIDENIWNPETDAFIPQSYSLKDLTGKLEARKVLMEEEDLFDEAGMPVISVISRLTEQKGIQFILDAAPTIFKSGAFLIVLGVGQEKFHQKLLKLKQKYPRQMGLHLCFDERLAHLLMAGSDIFLMPSQQEPCGLTQMYSLKYGTVPIVRKTGGLADTVEQFDPKTGNGNGFVFDKIDSKKFIEKLNEALHLYSKNTVWHKLIKNGMKADFSWSNAAHKYTQVYRNCMSLMNTQ